jgi:ATP-binding cassette subfamily B protein
MEKDDKPQAAPTVRAYITEATDALKQVAWVFSEFFTPGLRRLAFMVSAFTLVTMGLEFFVPFLTGRMIDGLVAHDARSILLALGASVATIAVGFVSDLVVNRWSLCLDGKTTVIVQEKVSRRFFEKSLGQHLREGTELSVGNVQKGFGAVDTVINTVQYQVVPTLAKIVAAFLLMLWLSPRLAFALILIGILYLAYSLVLSQRSNVAGEPVDEKRRFADRYRNDRWNAVERCKNNGLADAEADAIRDVGQQHADAFFRMWSRLDPLYNLRGTFLELFALGLMGYGMWMVWHGELTVGALLPIFSWARGFSSGLRQLSHFERQLHKHLPAIVSLRKAVFVPSDISDKLDAIDLAPDSVPTVELRGVGLTYAESSDEKDGDAKPKPSVLRGVSLVINPGEKVAVVGPSGAGKTTLSRLLLRYFDPTEGAVLVNGRDLRDYRHASWIAAVGHIAQQPQVFDGTIRDNLLYGLAPEERAKVSDDELWTVMRRLKIDFGSRLTEGLETKVGRSGLKLSGGEAQRLLIGAAVIRHPRFMIIDEATSSLDSDTEREVQAGLEEALTGGMSALVIAHRLSTVRHLCTKFVVLRATDELGPDELQIEAIASSFEELYEISPTFRRLADAQGLALCDLRERVEELPQAAE